jgi:hypothetical protein
MAIQTLSYLKTQNRDFNNVLDSFANIQDGLTRPLCTTYSNAVTSTGDVTWAYATHANRPLVLTGAGTVTLPAVANLQGDIWVVNGAADGTQIAVSPNSNDKFLWDIAGAGGTDNKDVINTAATAKKGDYIKIRYGSGDGWLISEFGGTWADEA